MNYSDIIDQGQRKINSILFRFVLLFYSLIIVCNYLNNFNFLIYLVGVVLYLCLFFKLTDNSKLRLLNDFAFINFILLGKNPNDVLLFIFLILPIINSINFSGNKKSVILYIYTFLSFCFQLCYYHNKIEANFISSNLFPLVSLFALWFMNWYTDQRMKIRKFREDLNSGVDNFYITKDEIKKPHKIYKQLINIIHENTKKIIIEDVFCFSIHKFNAEKENLVLVNGSSFVWSCSIDLTDYIEILRKKETLIDVEIEVDGNKKGKNLFLYSKVENQEYLYVFITKKSLPAYYLAIGFFNRTLIPAFHKISRVLLSEKKLQEHKDEEIVRLSHRRHYVNRANSTMHYVRNRLSPFSNLIKMLEKFDSVQNDKGEIIRELIKQETDRSRIELLNIIKRADYMLEKNNNPFAFMSLEEISIRKVYSILKTNVNGFFPETEIKLDIQEDVKEKFVHLNEDGFVLFLSDWLNNMSKYKKEIVAFSFIFTNEMLQILFVNDHNLNKTDSTKLITDLTSNDRNEIMRRTTHGLYNIKMTLEEMDVPFEVFMDESLNINFKLNLKKYSHENSSV